MKNVMDNVSREVVTDWTTAVHTAPALSITAPEQLVQVGCRQWKRHGLLRYYAHFARSTPSHYKLYFDPSSLEWVGTGMCPDTFIATVTHIERMCFDKLVPPDEQVSGDLH